MYRIRVGSRDIETDSAEEAIALARYIRTEREREQKIENEKRDEAWIASMHQPVNV